MCIHLGIAECCTLFRAHCDIDLDHCPVSIEVSPKFGMWLHIEGTECHVLFPGHCDLDLSSKKIAKMVCPMLSNNFP